MAGCRLWEEWQDVARGTILGTHALGLLFRAARGSQFSGVSEEVTFPLELGPAPPRVPYVDLFLWRCRWHQPL